MCFIPQIHRNDVLLTSDISTWKLSKLKNFKKYRYAIYEWPVCDFIHKRERSKKSSVLKRHSFYVHFRTSYQGNTRVYSRARWVPTSFHLEIVVLPLSVRVFLWKFAYRIVWKVLSTRQYEHWNVQKKRKFSISTYFGLFPWYW